MDTVRKHVGWLMNAAIPRSNNGQFYIETSLVIYCVSCSNGGGNEVRPVYQDQLKGLRQRCASCARMIANEGSLEFIESGVWRDPPELIPQSAWAQTSPIY